MNEQKPAFPAAYIDCSVFRFFEDICAIPHGSGNEAAIASYIENFASKKGLFCHRDEVHNVFIRLPASEGCEQKPALLLQGHTDMVCEKEIESPHDFSIDSLSLFIEDGKLGAKGTTLGGDNGVAVAMMLALLDSPPEKHPTIECLFTVSEETGLEGANAFDPEAVNVQAKTMINLDSESESTVTVGCAGGVRTDITFPVIQEPLDSWYLPLRVSVSGFSGGHSGVEINEGHTNAIKFLVRLLEEFPGTHDYYLLSIEGGGKDNAIPRDASAIVAVCAQSCSFVGIRKFEEEILAFAEVLRKEPHVIPADKNFVCTVSHENGLPKIQMKNGHNILQFIYLLRDGVFTMNAHIPGLVASSRNLGIVKTLTDEDGNPTAVQCSFSSRSACESQLDASESELAGQAVICQLQELDLSAISKDTIAEELISVQFDSHGRYPGWDYAPVSPIRDLWCQIATDVLGKEPRIEAIHAGLECGILRAKMPDMDIISVGPDMWDIHTPRERLGIDSTERVYRILRQVVAKMAE